MGRLDKLFGRESPNFAKELAQELKRRYPPESERGEGKKISGKGLSNILENVFEKAVDFKQKKGVGYIGTVRMSNTFKWELEEIGYSKKFIEIATEGLVVYLTRGKPGTDPESDK